MTQGKLSEITCLIRNRIVSILFQQISIPAEIFFALILIKQYGLFNQLDTTYTIFYLGLAFFLLTCYNHFLLYSAVLTSTIGPLGLYNLFIGFLSANQKWKLYLFWFTTEYYLTRDSRGILDIFVIATSFFICVEIYRGLIFPTNRDNIAYFTGFSTLFMARVLRNVVEVQTLYNLGQIQLICILPAIALLSFGMINLKMKNLDPAFIKSPTIFTQYMLQLKVYLKDDENIHVYIFKHKKQCQDSTCFCKQQPLLQVKIPQEQTKTKLTYEIINHIYTQFLLTHKWSNQDKTYLIHKYVEFLIESDKIPKAMRIVSEMDYSFMSYFNKCLNYRVRTKIRTWMVEQEYFDINRHKLREICMYDLQVGYVVKEIREILFQKIELWKQLCKQNPELKYLQVMGIKIVERIQNLHQYFVFKLRPSEQILAQYKGTIIYATYLFLTTNYTEFAHSLAKKTQKLLQESKNQFRSGKQYGLFLKVVASYEKKVENLFELVITNVSSSLTDILGKRKQDLLLKNAIHLIPQHFRGVYAKVLDNFITSNKLEIGHFKFLNRSIPLPFKINHNQVIFLEVAPTLQFDMFTNTMTLKCLLKKPNQNKINFILDLEGQVLYSEFQNYNQAYDKTTKEVLDNFKKSWKKLKVISPFETTITVNQNTLTANYSAMNPDQLDQLGLEPLVHLEIKSEVFNTEKLKVPNFVLKNRLKNLQGVIETKENDSQSSNSSRKQSIQNVLILLMGSSSLKTQVCLAATLLLLLLSSVGIFFVCSSLFTPWSTEYKQKNPIFTEVNLISLKHSLNQALSWNYDILRYNPAETQTKVLFHRLYSGNMDIVSIGKSRLIDIFSDQQKIFNDYILGQENQVSSILLSELNKTFTIKNPTISDIPPQQLTVKSILTNYIVDIFLLSNGEDFNKTLLSFSYLQKLYQEISNIINYIQTNLKTQVDEVRRNNTIIICFATFLLLLFLIPLWKITANNKKKHERIYSLLASLETKLILDQIRKLEKIQGEISKVGFENPSSTTIRNNTHSEISSNHPEQKKTNQNKLANVHILYEGITKMTVQQLANNGTKNQPNMKIRKRVGQVIIDGSNCDRKKIRKLDKVVIIFFILFLACIHALIWHKIRYINSMNDSMTSSINQINYMETSSIGLLNSKIYSDYYSSTNVINFGGNNLKSWLEDWIRKFKSSGIFNVQEQTQFETCTQNWLICKYNFSQKLQQSMIKKFVSDSYEASKIQKKTNAPFTSTDKKIRFQLYFAQQISDYLSNDKKNHLFGQFNALETNELTYMLENRLISITFFITAISFSIFSIYYTIKIKNNYIREVTLLSILNKEMLYNNKRVESFLHQLSKNS